MNCPQCGLKLSDPTFVTQATGTCPNCGHEFRADFDRATTHPIQHYFEDLKAILLKPRSFFRRMPRNAGLIQPLAFALIAHWLGTAIGYLWTSAMQHSGAEFFSTWMSHFGTSEQVDAISRNGAWIAARQSFMDWFWGMGSVIVDPFVTLASILITSFFVFIGARILVVNMADAPAAEGAARHSHAVTYESAVRIIAYGTVASICRAIPWLGGFFAVIYSLYISVEGAREIYRISTGRALAVVLFPKIMLLGVFAAALGAMFFFALKIFTLFMGFGS